MKTLRELEHEIDAAASAVIADAYPAAWEENYITLHLLQELQRRFGHISVHDFRHVIRVAAKGYKYRGPTENKFGDIAMQFAIRYPDGNGLDGRTYLEAKRRDPKRNYYKQLKLKQVEALLSSAPRLQLLLYDPSPVSVFEREATQVWADNNGRVHPGRGINAITVPAYLFPIVKHRNASLYQHGMPLGHQITQRFIYGLDLHHTRSDEEEFEKYSSLNPVPNFLLSIGVAHGGEEEPLPPEPLIGDFEEIE